MNTYKMKKEETTEQQMDAYLNGLIAKFKKDPQYELKQELGRLLLRHINSFTPKELKRYEELKH